MIRCLWFVPLVLLPTLAFAQSETIEYYQADLVGSIRIVYDAAGNVIGRQDYTPFGTITAGLSLLRSVAKAGVASNANGAGDGPPKESVIINSVSIKRS